MNAITGIWKNGTVVLDEPVRWPEGCRVIVEPEVEQDAEEAEEDPQSIAKWLAEFDAIPPWDMCAEEEARWQADRQAVKDYTLEKMKQQPRGDWS